MSDSNSNNSAGNNTRRGLLPFFISHSGGDRGQIVNVILRIFDHHTSWHQFGGRPHTIINRDVLSRSQRPHWRQIRDEIQRSDAVLLILSAGIIEQVHTQNWVAFEIGVAAGCEPPRPVIVIKAQDVQIPIPYVDHYYPYSPTFPAPHWRGRDRQNWEGQFWAIMYPMLSDAHYRPHFPQNRCPHCNLRYYHHGGERPFRCPCCSNLTSRIDGNIESDNR